MMMYRPFLHYVSRAFATANVDRRSYACAAACVSVARNIVHITVEMKRRGLLIGSYWFVMYTAYFSILSLVYFVLENPQSATGTAIMKDAIQGRDMLASLAKRSLAADRCSHSLAVSPTGHLSGWPIMILSRAFLQSCRSNSRSVKRHRSLCRPPGNDGMSEMGWT